MVIQITAGDGVVAGATKAVMLDGLAFGAFFVVGVELLGDAVAAGEVFVVGGFGLIAMEGGRIFSREHALDDLGLLVVVAKPLLAFEEFGAVGQPGVAEGGFAGIALVWIEARW